MTTPEKIPEPDEPQGPGAPLLSLVRQPPVSLTKAAPDVALLVPPADPADEGPRNDEEFDDFYEEHEPFLVRVQTSLTAAFGSEMWKSIVELFDIRGFLGDLIGDIVTGSQHLVKVSIEWVMKPDGKDAWKPIAMRAAVFIVPGILLGRAIFVHQRKDLFPLVLFCWCMAAWTVGASGMADSKKRKKAKKKARKKQRKKLEKKRQQAAKKQALAQQPVDDDQEDGEEYEDDEPEVPVLSREEQREALRAWIEAQILANPKGKNGIHMVDLYSLALRDGVTTPDTDPTTFRKLLEQTWGFKVGQVKIGGKNGDNWTGVKLTSVQRAD